MGTLHATDATAGDEPVEGVAGDASPLGDRPTHGRRSAERQRRCAVSRTVQPAANLIRFVNAPDGTLVADVRERLPGRGVWVEARRESVRKAMRGKVFARGLKSGVTVPDDLDEQVSTLLRRRALDMLSMANKAGAIVTGFDKVAAAIASRKASFLLQAADASMDGRRKLFGKARAAGIDETTPFTIAEMSLALGRANVVHAATMNAPVAQGLRAAIQRLLDFDGKPADQNTITPDTTRDGVPSPDAFQSED
ncbi:MAG: RNA-binding protein [Pseudomonadota bacterium]